MVDPRTSAEGIREYIKEVNSKIVITIDFIGFSENVKYWNEYDRLFEVFLLKIRHFLDKKHFQNQ